MGSNNLKSFGKIVDIICAVTKRGGLVLQGWIMWRSQSKANPNQAGRCVIGSIVCGASQRFISSAWRTDKRYKVIIRVNLGSIPILDIVLTLFKVS